MLKRGAKWHFDKGKSLAISVLKKWRRDPQSDLFHLQCVISLAIFESLRALGQAQWHIKWPNDIMSGNKKLGGILIENFIKSELISSSIIGIGLNINEEKFKNLPNATSLFMEINKKV